VSWCGRCGRACEAVSEAQSAFQLIARAFELMDMRPMDGYKNVHKMERFQAIARFKVCRTSRGAAKLERCGKP